MRTNPVSADSGQAGVDRSSAIRDLTGKPNAVLPSKSCTWPVGLAPEDVTATVKAKLLLVDGCFALVTVRVVCEATCVPPPPPPPLLPPPHPKVKLNAQSSPKPSAERS